MVHSPRNAKCLAAFAVLALASLIRCDPDPDTGPQACAIAPPQETKIPEERINKASAELAKLLKLPINVSFETDAKRTFDQTYQELGEKNAACHMLLATATCLAPRAKDLSERLITYVIENQQCGRELPAATPATNDIMTGTYAGFSHEVDTEQLPGGKLTDLSKAPHKIFEYALDLNFKNGAVSGTMKRHKTEWEITGYYRDARLVLAYRTAGENGRGFGTFFLQPVDNDSTEIFSGYIEGRDCSLRRLIRSPFLLVKGDQDSTVVRAAEQRYEVDKLQGTGEDITDLPCH